MTFTVNEKTMIKPKVGDKFVCTCDERASYGFYRGEVYTVKGVDEHDCVEFTEGNTAWDFKFFPFDFEPVTAKSEQPKPPLGLRPWRIADAERVVEILDAMKRYTAECKPIPEEWMEELIEKVVIDYEQ